jgi:Leucine carboxyl methyltransferase
VLTAVARALHREEPRPWVIDDYLALGLAGREGRALLGQLRAEVPRPYLLAFSRWMCARARFAEDIVEQAVAAGTGRYVILGAGLDSFACRRNDLLGRLRVFEVDHPATQSWKRRRLTELGVELPARMSTGLARSPTSGRTRREPPTSGARLTSRSLELSGWLPPPWPRLLRSAATAPVSRPEPAPAQMHFPGSVRPPGKGRGA